MNMALIHDQKTNIYLQRTTKVILTREAVQSEEGLSSRLKEFSKLKLHGTV